MQPKLLFRIALALAVSMSVSSPADAQLGKIGGAIKKKAKEKAAEKAGEKVAEVVVGKDKMNADSAKAAGSAQPAGAPAAATVAAKATTPAQTIDADVLTRFARSLDLEITGRSVSIKRSACLKKVESSQEAMDILMSIGPEQEKIDKSNVSDEQKVAAVQRLITVMEQKRADLEVKRCGAAVAEMNIPEHERIAAEAGAFSHTDYARLKERVLPYCAARAKGSDTPANGRLVYTEEEMAAMRPRCTALLATLSKLS